MRLCVQNQGELDWPEVPGAHYKTFSVKQQNLQNNQLNFAEVFSCIGKKMHFESLVNIIEQSPNYHGRYLKFYNVFLEVLQIDWLPYTFDKYRKS